ncbi:hypothetical protein ACIPUD_35870, partial [Bradyrhizobium sp. CAR08]
LVTRATSSRNGGRHHFGTGGRLQIGMVGEIISESWATSIGIRRLPMSYLDAMPGSSAFKQARCARWIDNREERAIIT